MDGGVVDAGSLAAQGDGDWDAFIHPVDTSTQVIVEPHQKTASCVAGRYLKGAVLGEGSYGKVKEMLDVLSLHRRAVKILNKRRLRKIPSGESNVEREIQLLRHLKHEHVVKLIEVLYNEEKLKIYMVMEYCVCPLEEMLKSTKEQKFPLQQGHNYFCQTIHGLEYLHSQRIVHKDLKPDNLLLSQQGVVKISDFGVAERLDLFSSNDHIHTSQGSPVFQPPEVSLGHDSMSGFKLDVWAVGVTLYHFVSGDYPFMGDTIFQLFEAIGKGVYTMPSGLSDSLEDLIRGMLAYDSDNRLGVQEIKMHPWFKFAHPLQKKETWIAIPPLYDFEHDPLRGLTCMDALMSLHRHNLPSCPIYLSEEHMMHLMSRGPHPTAAAQLQSVASMQGVQDGVLDAATASFTGGSVSSNGGGDSSGVLGNRHVFSTGETSRADSFITDGCRTPLGVASVDGGGGGGEEADGHSHHSHVSDTVNTRRQNFFKSKAGHSSSDMSTISQLSQRLSETSSPSSGGKKTSVHSQGEASSNGPLFLVSHRNLMPALSTNEEEEDAEGVEAASSTPNSTNGGACLSPLSAAKVHSEPQRSRLAGRESSRKEINADRRTRPSVTSTSATSSSPSHHGTIKRMRRAVQCRQQ